MGPVILSSPLHVLISSKGSDRVRFLMDFCIFVRSILAVHKSVGLMLQALNWYGLIQSIHIGMSTLVSHVPCMLNLSQTSW